MTGTTDSANRPDRITVMRDAKLIAHALKYADADRRDFILRLRRSFHQFGSLTTAMREALVSDNAEMRGWANRRRGR